MNEKSEGEDHASSLFSIFMKKSRQIELIFILTCLFAVLGHFAYDNWDRWFPEFSVGTCVQNLKTRRVYVLVEDKYSGVLDSGVPALIIETGLAMPGEHAEGSTERISVYDESLRRVPCPPNSK